MYVIKTAQDIVSLHESNKICNQYLQYIENYFYNLYESLNEDETIEEFRLEHEGYLIVLENEADLRSLPIAGLNPDAGMFVASPEFINKVELGGMVLYEIAVLYDNDCIYTYFLSEKECSREILEWIDEYL